MTQAEIIKTLTEAIDQGVHKYGDQLPTTRELAERFKTNPQTVASALTVMAGMGLVQVQRRLGTKVIAGRRRKIRLGAYRSANRTVPTGTTAWKKESGDGSEEGPTTVSQTLTTEADADTDIPVGTQVVERMRTRFDGDGAPCQHKRTLLIVEAATLTPDGWTGLPPMLTPGDVVPPEGMTVAKWLGMGVVKVVYEISTAPASGPAAAALTLPEGTPTLRIVSKGLKADGSVAYSTVTTAPLRSTVSWEIQEDEVG